MGAWKGKPTATHCIECGKAFDCHRARRKPICSNECRSVRLARAQAIANAVQRQRRNRTRKMICSDCGVTFMGKSKNNRKRCEPCRVDHMAELARRRSSLTGDPVSSNQVVSCGKYCAECCGMSWQRPRDRLCSCGHPYGEEIIKRPEVGLRGGGAMCSEHGELHGFNCRG